MGIVEVVEKQNEIIRMQSEIIDGLFVQLAQHLTVKEMDSLPELAKMEEAVRMRKSVEGGTGQ